MKIRVLVALALGLGCSSGEGSGTPGTGGMPGGSGGSTAGSGGSTAGSGGSTGGMGGDVGGGGNPGGTGGQPAAGIPTAPMPIISLRVPAFASSGDAAAANDGSPMRMWGASPPAWLALDLSSVPEAQRQDSLIAVYGGFTQDYLNPPPGTGKRLPVDWIVEINSTAGATPPAAGWTQVASVTGNIRSGVHHPVALKGARWVRISVSKATDATLNLDLDIHSAPSGATDSWLFMGDSITALSFSRPFSDLPKQVSEAKPGYYPAVIPAGIGGTNTRTALAALEQHLMGYPGKFVTLNYGTNDNTNEYMMEGLVQMVIAKGKTPVVPRMPWSDTKAKAGPEINAMIDAIYAKYPQVVRGPDLWAGFMGRTDLIPPGDVHPNAAGQAELRKLWAAAMIKIYQ